MKSNAFNHWKFHGLCGTNGAVSNLLTIKILLGFPAETTCPAPIFFPGISTLGWVITWVILSPLLKRKFSCHLEVQNKQAQNSILIIIVVSFFFLWRVVLKFRSLFAICRVQWQYKMPYRLHRYADTWQESGRNPTRSRQVDTKLMGKLQGTIPVGELTNCPGKSRKPMRN